MSDLFVYLDKILFLDPRAKNLVGQVAVIAEQDQTFGVFVQPTDGYNVVRDVYNVLDLLVVTLGINRYNPAWFIKGPGGNFWLDVVRYLDTVEFGNKGTEFSDGTIDQDSAFTNKLLAITTRTVPIMREILL